MALILILYGCVDERSNSRGDRSQAPPDQSQSQSQSAQGSDLTGSNSAETDDPITDAALKVMAQLGYDTSKLTAYSTLLKGQSLQWLFKFSGDTGDVATLVIDETSLKPVMFFTGTKVGDIVPPSLRSGGDIPSQIAAALGLETQGYRRVTWLPGWNPTEHAEYRKYAMSGQLEIAVSQVSIFVPALNPIVINWSDSDLMPDLDIKVPRDKAIETAAAFLHVPETEPTHVDLIQFGINLLNPTAPKGAYVVWEVVMGGHVARVRVDDGSVTGGNEPLPPPL